MTADSTGSSLVLFVDDDRRLEADLRPLFTGHGIRVAASDWGLAAYEAATRLLPDVILLGPASEHTGAVLLIEQYRVDPATRHIPIVVLTPSRSRVFFDRLLAAGAAELLLAPTPPAHVFDVVHRWGRVTPTVRSLRELRRRVIAAREAALAQQACAADMERRIAELRARLEETGMAMLGADSSGECVAANAAVCEFVRHSQEELLGRKVWDLGLPIESPEEGWMTFLERGIFQGPCALVRRDGIVLPVDMSASTHILPGLHVAAFDPQLPG